MNWLAPQMSNLSDHSSSLHSEEHRQPDFSTCIKIIRDIKKNSMSAHEVLSEDAVGLDVTRVVIRLVNSGQHICVTVTYLTAFFNLCIFIALYYMPKCRPLALPEHQQLSPP